MKQDEVLQLLDNYKKQLTTVSSWNQFAKEKGLPNAHKLINIFGSWNNLKSSLGLMVSASNYSKEELIRIAKKHKSHIRTIVIWDEFASKNGLPVSGTFIKAFGKWSEVKRLVGNKPEKKRLYSKDDIANILKQHSDHYVNRQQWDIYAKDNKLPTYKTIRNHFTYDEILELVNKNKLKNYTSDDLIKIGLKHKEVFLSSSMKAWDVYATENKLPHSHTFFKTFNSWQKAKYEVEIRK